MLTSIQKPVRRARREDRRGRRARRRRSRGRCRFASPSESDDGHSRWTDMGLLGRTSPSNQGWAQLGHVLVGGLLPPLSPLLCFALRRHPPLPFFHRSDRTIAAGVHLRRHGGNKPRAGGEARHLNLPRRRGTEAKTSSMCLQSERKKAPQEFLPRRR